MPASTIRVWTAPITPRRRRRRAVGLLLSHPPIGLAAHLSRRPQRQRRPEMLSHDSRRPARQITAVDRATITRQSNRAPSAAVTFDADLMGESPFTCVRVNWFSTASDASTRASISVTTTTTTTTRQPSWNRLGLHLLCPHRHHLPVQSKLKMRYKTYFILVIFEIF